MGCDWPAPSEPCHYPVHRGKGGGKAGWEPTEWVPLCRRCHDILDHRNGVSPFAAMQTELVKEMVDMRLAAWQERWR